jgi:predicted GNAT superfamily acetyltransferase
VIGLSPSPRPPADPPERCLDTPRGRLWLRSIATVEEGEQCLALQLETWGEGFQERISPHLLLILRKVGGVAVGAWDEAGALAGFVIGLTGPSGGRLVHWSHILAVGEAWRGCRLGRALKLYQRQVLLGLAVEEVYWTFDPLVARNAHLNLNRLGAEVAEYVRDHYGTGDDSRQAAGLGTDRFIAVWRLLGDRAARAVAGERLEGDLPPEALEAPVARPEADERWARVQVPRDIHRVLARDRAEAARWRQSSREAFEALLGAGFRVRGLVVDAKDGDLASYVLERAPQRGGKREP